MKVAKSYKIVFLIVAFIMSTMLALGMMKSPSVYADSKVSASSYFTLNGATATFEQEGLKVEAKDNVEFNFKNNLIVNDMSMKMKLPEGFVTSIDISLSSFYVNGNPKNWDTNPEGTTFEKTIVNKLKLQYKDGSTTLASALLNGQAINDIQVENGYAVIDFAIENAYLTVLGNDMSAKYNADEKIFYKVKNIDNRAVSSKITIGLDTLVDGDSTVGEFILEYVDQMRSVVNGDYKQSLMLADGETKLTPAKKKRAYLSEAFYLRQDNGGYTSIKLAGELYSMSYKACSLMGDATTLFLVNPNGQYNVVLEDSTSIPDTIRFNKGTNVKFGVGAKVDGEVVLFEEFAVAEVKVTDHLVDANFVDDIAPKYVYDEVAYASFLNALESEYTDTNSQGEKTSAGLGTELNVPSMKDLVFDNFYPYEDLNKEVHYRNQIEAITAQYMSFNLNQLGEYMFYVVFGDDADNTMKDEDFITEKDNVVTNGVYGEDSTVNNYVGNFIFRFEIDDNADIIVKAPEKQGNGYKGVEYKASKFIIDAEGCRKTYKLFYNKNINADIDDANWIEIPQASTISKEYYVSNGFSYDEAKKVNFDGELKFVPTRIGAYKIECTATSSVSERNATNSTIIKVASEPNIVEVPSKWLENNMWSVIFLSIGTLSLIGIIVLLCIKPKEQIDND